MKRIGKWSLAIIVILFVVAQFVPAARENPPSDPSKEIWSHPGITPDVAALLQRSCADCHSNKTQWPWYSRVAPVSWLLVNHVNEGRSHLNFSDWAQTPDPGKLEHLLEEICEEISGGAMPLRSYTLIHRDAKLSPAEVRTLCEWTETERRRLKGAAN
jgi:hypothetical protein